ncbi:hypothetical protein BRD01_14375 [Halobacteriales archaeon QS_8_65_32]|nr:MAG: hypothetical protein BRD01_14375 [Halobacteriales archaeon QS_8_65_32]
MTRSDSMQLGMDLAEGVEAGIRERFGFKGPKGRDNPGETIPPAGQPIAEADWGSMVHCYRDDLDLPRKHGTYTNKSASDSDSEKDEQSKCRPVVVRQ